MKNNTQQAKELLIQAIQSMPSDFALSEARSYMKSALNAISKIENRRIKRQRDMEIQEELQREKMVSMPQVYDPMAFLDEINRMIEEQKNIIKNPSQNNQEDEESSGDNETLFG